MGMNKKTLDILLAEDNLDDVEIAKRAFKKTKMANRLFVVRDGKEAVDFLFNQDVYSDKDKYPTPDLVLLDINMPKMNGVEVLKIIKENDTLKNVPVIMLTVSKRDEDIVKSYEYGCNSFLQKPVQFESFVELITDIGRYWGKLNVNRPR